MSTSTSTSTQKVALITGCSDGGIGHALAVELHNRGWRVFATARRVEAITGIDCDKVALDVTNTKSIKAGVDSIIEKAGHIDLLINNAGRGNIAPLIECDLDKDLRDTYETNVFGLLAVTQEVVKHMIPRQSGTIVNTGSVVGLIPSPWAGVYASSKHAVHCITDGLRIELKGFGIKVMCLAPGAITSNIGAKNVQALTLKENTVYKSVKDVIIARATLSQQANSTPTAVFAKMVIDQATKVNPPAYYIAGTNALKCIIGYYMPAWLSDWALSKQFKADQVKLVT